jgi:hypothetical protein
MAGVTRSVLRRRTKCSTSRTARPSGRGSQLSLRRPCQPREELVVHPHREVLALDVGRTDVLGVGRLSPSEFNLPRLRCTKRLNQLADVSLRFVALLARKRTVGFRPGPDLRVARLDVRQGSRAAARERPLCRVAHPESRRSHHGHNRVGQAASAISYGKAGLVGDAARASPRP